MLLTAVTIWLLSIDRHEGAGARAVGEQNSLRLALADVVGEIADATPTRLCLQPDPNSLELPTVDPDGCRAVGDNWGYTPVGGDLDGLAQHGGPLHAADATAICYFARERGSELSLDHADAPHAHCLELTGGGTLQVRSRAPRDGTTHLGAAVASSYEWAAADGWRTRVIANGLQSPDADPDGNLEDAAVFAYTDFEGRSMSVPVAPADLSDIALIRIRLRRAADGEAMEGVARVLANQFSPCRTPITSAPASTTTASTTTTQTPTTTTPTSGNEPSGFGVLCPSP